MYGNKGFILLRQQPQWWMRGVVRGGERVREASVGGGGGAVFGRD